MKRIKVLAPATKLCKIFGAIFEALQYYVYSNAQHKNFSSLILHYFHNLFQLLSSTLTSITIIIISFSAYVAGFATVGKAVTAPCALAAITGVTDHDTTLGAAPGVDVSSFFAHTATRKRGK